MLVSSTIPSDLLISTEGGGESGDDLAEIFLRSFLGEAVESSSGMGRMSTV